MGFYEVNSAIIKGLLNTIDNTPLITHCKEHEADVIRLVEEPFIVTEEIMSNRAVITAHVLEEYKFTNYSLNLEKTIDTWLHRLLQAQGYVE